MTGRERVSALLAHHIARSGGRDALIHLTANGDVQSLSWQGVADRVARLVAAIDRQGFQPGDRLIHSLGNRGDAVVMAIASLITGTIEVPLPPNDCTEAVGQARHESLCRLVDGRDFDEAACESAKDALPLGALLDRELSHGDHDPALILFTSGSTGAPRGVTLSRRNLFSNARGKLAALPQRNDDVRLTVLPLWHAYARTCDLMTWLLSGCSLGVAFGWTGWQQLAPSVKPTLINTVPSLASRLLAEAANSASAGHLRAVGCGGAAMHADTFARFSELGVSVIQGYGLTEASPVICSASPENARPDRVGLPIPGCETHLGPDGRLSVRGEGVMLGYWNDPAATSQKI
ncbi:MAG: AMP-binding protein, partial [Planctomycetaceae bacterium]